MATKLELLISQSTQALREALKDKRSPKHKEQRRYIKLDVKAIHDLLRNKRDTLCGFHSESGFEIAQSVLPSTQVEDEYQIGFDDNALIVRKSATPHPDIFIETERLKEGQELVGLAYKRRLLLPDRRI